MAVKSVLKALDLLDAIVLNQATSTGMALKDMAEANGLPVNTAHNLIKSLETCGYVERRERGIYAPGEKCLELGRTALSTHYASRRKILPVLQDFVEKEGEALVCTTLFQGERITIARIESTHAIRVAHSMIEQTPLFSKPTGRVLAAWASESQLAEIIDKHGYPCENWKGITNEKELQTALAEIREQQVCTDEVDELVAISCPVFQLDRKPWGAIGTYAPVYRCNSKRRKELAASLKEAAESLSRAIANL
ncbi:MAG: IclR family transcriptional regulator [Candidatus Sumerlaeia bacterium]